MIRKARLIALTIGVAAVSLVLMVGMGATTEVHAGLDQDTGESYSEEQTAGPSANVLGLTPADATTITMVFVPSGDPAGVARAAEQLAALVEQETGHHTYAYVAACNEAAVDALASGEADIGWLPAKTYVLAHDQFGVEVKLAAERFGSATYRGQFLVRQDSGIDELADLAGKNFAFVDQSSDSSFMYPTVLISRTQGVGYATFFDEVVYAGTHNAVVAAVYDEQHSGTAIDGGAMYEDARNSLTDQYPDVFTVTKVITYTDPIPTDAISVRPGLEPAVASEIISGLVAIADTLDGQQALGALNGTEGLQPIDDAAFDPVREVVAAFEYDDTACADVAVVAPGSDLALVHASGGGITATVEIPGAAVTRPVRAVAQPIPAITYLPAHMAEPGLAFSLGTVVSETGDVLRVLETPYTVTVNYEQAALGTVREDTLALYIWNGGEWVPAPDSTLDATSNTVTATATQVVRWALLGEGALTIVFVPTGDDAAEAAERIAGLLSDEVGAPVYAFVAGCHGGAVDALARGEADVGFLPATPYVVAHDQHGVQVKLVVERFGATTYRGQFIVREDSGINDLADLAGANFASPDMSSSSGFLFPAVHISRTQGITYELFFNETIFVGSHGAVARAVYDGDFEGTPVDCGATYEDARQSLVDELPDVYTQTKIIAYTDYIPNDTVSVAPHLSAEVAQALTDGFLALAQSDEGSEALQAYSGATGLQTIDDSAYDPVREMLSAFDIEFETCSSGAVIVPAAGGAVSLTMQNGLSTTVDVPAGAFSQPVEIEISPLAGLTEVPQGLADAGLAFRLTAVVSGTNEPLTTLSAPVTITARYDPEALGGVAESSLSLYFWDGAQWVAEPTSEIDSAQQTVFARPDHFSLWAVLGERWVFLPLLLRGDGG